MVKGDTKFLKGFEKDATLTANCPAGSMVTGGGLWAFPSRTFAISASYPDSAGTMWTVKVLNVHPSFFGKSVLTAYAVCLPVS